jgi:hypothetical protein
MILRDGVQVPFPRPIERIAPATHHAITEDGAQVTMGSQRGDIMDMFIMSNILEMLLDSIVNGDSAER